MCTQLDLFKRLCNEVFVMCSEYLHYALRFLQILQLVFNIWRVGFRGWFVQNLCNYCNWHLQGVCRVKEPWCWILATLYDHGVRWSCKFINVLNFCANDFSCFFSSHKQGKGKLYRVIQEEWSIFLEVIVWVIVRKKNRMNMCLILNGYRERAVWINK